ncbi:MAG: hypothetical protein GY813_05735, partial [Halieaceae bacterium]|nr:hypothetical protein [Halieaceae bacterium]
PAPAATPVARHPRREGAQRHQHRPQERVPREVARSRGPATHPRHGTKPHGPEWRDLMQRFGADSAVTFDLDLEGVPQRKQSTYRYHCGCQLHDVSATRHNRMKRGRVNYHCVICDGRLVSLD